MNGVWKSIGYRCCVEAALVLQQGLWGGVFDLYAALIYYYHEPKASHCAFHLLKKQITHVLEL